MTMKQMQWLVTATFIFALVALVFLVIVAVLTFAIHADVAGFPFTQFCTPGELSGKS